MSSLHFTKTELASAIARGVRQCVVIGKAASLRVTFEGASSESLRVFAVESEEYSESLATSLEKTNFDKLKASLFVWLGDAGYRTADAAIASLAFIASLPRGSGVLFDYAAERTSLGPATHTALDALTSRICEAGGTVKYMIQPQALMSMLRSLGFQQIVDRAQEELPVNLVSAVV